MDSAIQYDSLRGYFFGLALLFGLLGLCWFAARRLRARGAFTFLGATQGLHIETRLNLGPKKFLVVLKYQDKRLLLGVTDQQISLLDSSPLGEEERQPGENPGTEDNNAQAALNFRKLLHAFRKKEA